MAPSISTSPSLRPVAATAMPQTSSIFQPPPTVTPSMAQPTLAPTTVAPTPMPTIAPTPDPPCIVELTFQASGTVQTLSATDFVNSEADVSFDAEQDAISCTPPDAFAASCSSDTFINRDVKFINCNHVTCQGAFGGRGCYGSSFEGSGRIDCIGALECADATFTNIPGTGAFINCPGQQSCDGANMTLGEDSNIGDTDALTVYCGEFAACNDAVIDFSKIVPPSTTLYYGTVICAGGTESTGDACIRTTVTSKCLVCSEENGGGCGNFVTFQGQTVPPQTEGYCGDCTGVPEAEGLSNICP
eukprot:CAMPEP_0172444236 /NCGR_PEP_ID=MMETSP1065-20121228/4297_1 /TAXON_ID=265537 /ORGANISM="Amphiprora paludosa, Strain CCMP125" /LENGTH=301 /DNA_ID=CAMNT_0013194689 /DNA_START=205 /DNA_END=1110 /DNA_ORIENTATION=+